MYNNYLWRLCPKRYLAAFNVLKPLISAFELEETRRSKDFEALKLINLWSGHGSPASRFFPFFFSIHWSVCFEGFFLSLPLFVLLKKTGVENGDSKQTEEINYFLFKAVLKYVSDFSVVFCITNKK